MVGIDHPFHVAATIIDGGLVATYDRDMDSGDPATSIAAKVDERVADVLFVLESLRSGDDSLGRFLEGTDLERIGILGHSNGGLTAFEACRANEALDACLNMDGLAAGGLLGHREGATAPPTPFLILTKETFLAPTIGEHIEEFAAPAVRAVIPDAAHDDFTDGPLFQPSFNPGDDCCSGNHDQPPIVERGLLRSVAQGAEGPSVRWACSPADLYISVYPLEGLQPIPTSERPHRAGFVGGFLRQHMLFDRWVRSGSKVLMETRG